MDKRLNCSYENLKLLDFSPTGICVVDSTFKVYFWNRCLTDWTGLKKEEMEGTDLRDYADKLTRPQYYRRIESVFSGGPPVIFSPQLHSYILPVKLPDGTQQIQSVKVTSLPCPGNTAFFAIFTVEDVTDLTKRIHDYRTVHARALEEIEQRKKAEEALQKSLEQKNFLFRELHHRIKNNLSLIAGMITLQGESLHHPHDLYIMEELEKKIHSISLIHEKLYLSEDLSTFDLQEYLEELIPHVAESSATKNVSVKISRHIESVSTNIDTAIPLSMIITELLLNSLKYAFTGRENGFIGIYFGYSEGSYVLRFRDDGVGLPDGFSIEESDSLGIRLVYNFVEQLGGTVSISSGEGTEYTIIFPPDMIESH